MIGAQRMDRLAKLERVTPAEFAAEELLLADATPDELETIIEAARLALDGAPVNRPAIREAREILARLQSAQKAENIVSENGMF